MVLIFAESAVIDISRLVNIKVKCSKYTTCVYLGKIGIFTGENNKDILFCSDRLPDPL